MSLPLQKVCPVQSRGAHANEDFVRFRAWPNDSSQIQDFRSARPTNDCSKHWRVPRQELKGIEESDNSRFRGMTKIVIERRKNSG